MRKSFRNNKDKKVVSLFLLPTIILLIVFIVIPFIMAFGLSFTNQRLIPGPIPTKYVGFRDCIKLLNDNLFRRGILNTFYFALIVVPLQSIFALARFTWKGRQLVLRLIVALMIIPFEAIAISLLLMVNRFGWLDSYHVQVIPFIVNSFYLFLFYQFFIGLPKELEESALIDGAGWFRIYWNISLPLSKPIFASVAILHFLQHWGFFLWPLMVTRGYEYRPLPVAMQVFFGQYPRDWGDIMAFAAMMTIPVILLFIFLQKQYVNTVKTAGIK